MQDAGEAEGREPPLKMEAVPASSALTLDILLLLLEVILDTLRLLMLLLLETLRIRTSLQTPLRERSDVFG
jgi:hypothetical protein